MSIDDTAELLAAADEGPESLAESDQELQQLAKAMTRLESEQQLLLQLRYQQDLTLDEVARLMGLDDRFQARRRIDAALAALTRAMKI